MAANEDEDERRRRIIADMAQPFHCGPFNNVTNYLTQSWPRVEDALFVILTQRPNEFIPLSYEELYSIIYKGVVNYFGDTIFARVELVVSTHLRRKFVDQLSATCANYLDQFSFLLAQFFQAVNSICAIFHYMDRVYLARKRGLDLASFLKGLLATLLAENGTVFERLSAASRESFSVSPDTMMRVVKGLFSLEPAFAARDQELFTRFIPAAQLQRHLPATTPPAVEDLPALVAETRVMQDELILVHGFERTPRDAKRSQDQIAEAGEVVVATATKRSLVAER